MATFHQKLAATCKDAKHEMHEVIDVFYMFQVKHMGDLTNEEYNLFDGIVLKLAEVVELFNKLQAVANAFDIGASYNEIL